MSRPRAAAALALAMAMLTACAIAPPVTDVAASPWAKQSALTTTASPQEWVHKTFPGKTPTRFEYVRLDGRDALVAQAHASASMLRKKVRIEPGQLTRVRFSWKVPELMEQADMATRERDDACVRVVLAFEGDRSLFTPRDAALSELARALTGEEMPYATLMYVWSNRREPGTVIRSARTDRIRKLVVESGRGRLDQWLDYERDIRADYERVFGEKPGALVGVGLMTDSDNTQGSVRAWYGPVLFVTGQDAPR